MPCTVFSTAAKNENFLLQELLFIFIIFAQIKDIGKR